MITGTWIMAETGYPPQRTDLEYNVGNSGGGFDKLRFKFPVRHPSDRTEISTAIPLNRRNDGRRTSSFPPRLRRWYVFRSVSLPPSVSQGAHGGHMEYVHLHREGGYPEMLQPYDDTVITQVATGLFGGRRDHPARQDHRVQVCPGRQAWPRRHLLGEKNTASVARMREAVKGFRSFPPSPSIRCIPLKTTRNTSTGSGDKAPNAWYP